MSVCSSPLFIRTPVRVDEGPTMRPNGTLITSLKARPPNTVTFGGRRLGLQHRNLGDTIQPMTGSIQKGSAQYETQTINGTCYKEMSPSEVAQGHWLPEPSPSPQRDCLGDGIPQMPEPTGMGTVPWKRGIKICVLHQGAVGTRAGLQWLGDLASFRASLCFLFLFPLSLEALPIQMLL